MLILLVIEQLDGIIYVGPAAAVGGWKHAAEASGQDIRSDG